MNPTEYLYTKDHEWISISGDLGRVGITEYAQRQLGDIVFVELPEVGRVLKQGEQFGSIESVKAVSDLYCPMSGEVVEINVDTTDKPETINSDPYGSWMIVIKVSDSSELDKLFDDKKYEELIK